MARVKVILAALGLAVLLAVPAAMPVFRGFIAPYHGILGVARASRLPRGPVKAPGSPGGGF